MRSIVVAGSVLMTTIAAGPLALAADYPVSQQRAARQVASEHHVRREIVEVQPSCYVLDKAFEANRPTMPSRQHVYPFYVERRVPCDPRDRRFR